MILNTWENLTRRELERINRESRTQAITAWIIEAKLNFGSTKLEKTPNDYLPFKLDDNDSPVSLLRQTLKPRTIRVLKKLIKDGTIPTAIVKDFYQVEGLMEMLD